MTEVGEEANVLSGGRKKSTRERVRDRLLKKSDRSDKPRAKDVQRDEDLDEFLKSPPEGDKLPEFPSPSRKPVPRINVSSSPRWPDAQDVAGNEGSPHLVKDEKEALPHAPPKRRRRKGLTVKFVIAAPQIIGEGGDEAEGPTILISQRRQSKSAHSLTHDDGPQSRAPPIRPVPDPDFEAGSSAVDASDGNFRPRALARTPTGFGEARVGQETVATAKSMKDAEFELTLGEGNAPQAPNSRLLASAAGVKRKMLQDEARALTSAARDPSPEPLSQQQSATPLSRSPEILLAPSAAPEGQQAHPANASPSHLSHRGHSPSPTRPSPSLSHENLTRHSPIQQNLDPEPESKQALLATEATSKRKPLPRSLAPESKQNALTEFRAHARRYYTLFALAAEAVGPGLDAPLSRWVRAAAWWFLTAEINFKRLRRDLEDGATISQITASRRHMQAVVDLSKTAWIVEDMVFDYAKAQSLDLSSPESILKLIQSDPLSRFSRTLQYWQDLSNRFGSLVAAIRRSGFMASTSESLPLSAGTDTSIWLTCPALEPRVVNWLRSANPSWVKMDETVTPVEPFDLAKTIPLKSTANTVRMKPMFGRISGGFPNEPQISNVPCIMTTARRTGSYALVLFAASQDHDINVVIETDPVRREGIDWQPTILGVLLDFADGFEILIQFQQADYIHLKECYDLAMRVSTATIHDAVENANQGEKMIFRATSKSFERRSTEKVRDFPYEGEQRDCEIILWEQYEMLRDPSTAHKAHRGFRLSVILSANAPNLGILDVHIGGDKPILLHSSHEHSPPLVELMDDRRALLAIQFPRNRDFNRFYELLTSLGSGVGEDHDFDNVTLRSFSVEPSSSEARTFLAGAPWRNVQVTNRNAGSHDRSHVRNMTSADVINISVFSTHGVIVDRLLQGRSQVLMGLSVGDQPSLRLLRATRQDMGMTLRFRAAASNAPRVAEQLLAQSATSSTVWKYTFASLHELHTFQTCLTGADVLFDGTASSFLVSRGNGRRTKKEDLGTTRLQILLHRGPRQLRQVLAYFEDGQATNFTVDGDDVFESTNGRGSRFSIKLVEATVSLPSSSSSSSSNSNTRDDGGGAGEAGQDESKETRRGFLCFEAVPDKNGGSGVGGVGAERDDITITFEAEEDRDRFAQVLPAPVKRMSSLMGALHLT